MATIEVKDKILTGSGTSQLWTEVKKNFVAKEAGKGLSHNDLTDTLKDKLDGIADGAQVNVIETVKVNNAALEVTDKTVSLTVPTGAMADKDSVAETDLTEALANKINGKVDKVEGKDLSDNNYDNAAVLEVAKIKDKVDKVEGKDLSDNNYDNAAVAAVATIADKANASDVYTKTETDAAIKTAVAGTYKVKGTVTFENLPSLTSEDIAEGYVYNVSDAFTTTDSFVEGAGTAYPAGTNVVIVDVTESGAETKTYKYDCMAGTYDFSDFVKKDDLAYLTTAEVSALCTMD